ncbi:MAG: D-aminoacyl-tRNA deacylase [Halobacteriota archaeon]
MAIAIICSDIDKASENIKRRLFELAPWDLCLPEKRVWRYKHFQLLEVKGRFVDHNELYRDVTADLLIFASRHQSEVRQDPLITVHYTGDICEEAGYTNSNSLARAAPSALKQLAISLQQYATVEVLMEATHHGPYALKTPSLFVEIGSSLQEWIRRDLGTIVAQAVLDLDPKFARRQCATAVGFGGPHYAVRHTDVLLRTDVCFGHVFSTHQLCCLTEKRISEAFDKSNAQFAYFDKKSAGKHKKPIEHMVYTLGYDVLTLADITGRKNIPWHNYFSIRRTLRQNGVAVENKYVRISLKLLHELNTAKSSVDPQLNKVQLDPLLIKEVQKADYDSFKQTVEIERIVYLESKDRTISAIFVPADVDALALEKSLVEGCIAILKRHYEVEYLPSQSKLYITTCKFNPRLAESLGVSRGPLFAKLARGEQIKVNDKVIKPEDVFTRVKKVIDLTHA